MSKLSGYKKKKEKFSHGTKKKMYPTGPIYCMWISHMNANNVDKNNQPALKNNNNKATFQDHLKCNSRRQVQSTQCQTDNYKTRSILGTF